MNLVKIYIKTFHKKYTLPYPNGIDHMKHYIYFSNPLLPFLGKKIPNAGGFIYLYILNVYRFNGILA